MSTSICTHCGENEGTTSDHVFPSCLFVALSNDRGIKVSSCPVCNCKSEEGLLKSFFALFDDRLAHKRYGKELLHPQGKGDLRSFVRTCTTDLKVAYPEEQITRLFKKLFQGLRRYLLKDRWTFVSANDLTLFVISDDGVHQLLRQLPLRIGGPNKAYPIPPEFKVDGHFGNSFRDFRFGFTESNVIGLRYGRTFCGNELVLFALFCNES